MYETRGTTLWFDEWIWAREYRDNSFDGFVAPHNGHPTLVPVAIYRLLFATVGIDQSAPYRAVGIAGHLLCVALVYVYALRRVGTGLALLAAASILLLGPGWQNIIWGLQIGWLVSIAGGLGALLMLDRRDRIGDVAACALLLLTIAASGPGIAIAAGVLVEVVRGRGLRARLDRGRAAGAVRDLVAGLPGLRHGAARADARARVRGRLAGGDAGRPRRPGRAADRRRQQHPGLGPAGRRRGRGARAVAAVAGRADPDARADAADDPRRCSGA